MSYFIPVFALVLRPEEWHGHDPEAEAMELVGTAADDPSADLLTATFTNWWHIRAVEELAQAWGLGDLAVLSEHLAILSPADAGRIAAAIQRLLDTLLCESLPPSLSGQPLHIQHEELRTTLPAVQEASEVDEASGHVLSFLQFLVSLRSLSRRAAERSLNLLYYQPQP